MLKALELVGFKSFADRTRFDFPDGITVVVGPNGSGKSNVVDAIKWVLGAQSAKALRGAEMTDVIFKGSAEGGRKPANSAEVVLVLDNRTRILPMDADEVEVSRRVFRSGEGEYAINGRPSRLKDVRDLFRGTGVGVDAYSLIEQGKVDRLLQSSAKDRRAIFEEAAGISRFKAKKAEAERRLGRVDQNMVRLRDIVDEVGKRLSTLKSQASKAQRYREWTDQLIVKRTQLGLLDVHTLRQQLARVEQQVAESDGSRVTWTERVASSETQLDTFQQRLLGMQSELEAFNSRGATGSRAIHE
jgi:chromosome segregation protein